MIYGPIFGSKVFSKVKRCTETLMHVFFQCPFSVSCWNHLGILWDTSLRLANMIMKAKHGYSEQCFMEKFLLRGRPPVVLL
uniref:Reverse transcriptase zinc-binding domain-containing protein n=1 Tax=Oryza barthii TaxID=65489 RepID=A0A0D3H4S1_9ORYZ